jgi:hypothetical protein
MTTSRNKAVLVSLNVSIWTANKLDREVSKEVVDQKKLKNDQMARVWKSLLPKNTFFSAIHGLAAKARKFHYANTFAWVQEGARLLPTTNYMAYMEFMRAAKVDFDRAVAAFLNEYGQLQEVAKEALNSMFKSTDYPSAESLRSKFSFETVVMPVPAGEMFTAEVDDEESARVREDIEKSVQEAFRAANRDLWERMYSTIAKVQERLVDPKGVREASLTSLREMLSLLDRLNVSGDERLERLRKQAEERLNTMSLKDFKSDEVKRAAAMAEAARIQEAMSAFMGGDAHGQ